jgi:hypothetical protein
MGYRKDGSISFSVSSETASSDGLNIKYFVVELDNCTYNFIQYPAILKERVSERITRAIYIFNNNNSK